MQPTAVLPLKAFDVAKERLAPLLTPPQRSALARAAADRVASACVAGGFAIIVVTGDETVARWAAGHSAHVVPDPGGGLDAVCDAGVAATHGPWMVVHGDLPLLDRETTERARRSLIGGGSVIAPSRDGGTNLLGSNTRVHFAYGPGSFHRHLAAVPDATILTGFSTLIELDTPQDLAAASTLVGGDWLIPYIPGPQASLS
jgi:2-phospho-L-lactate/phosphoenolpyruvate guanylyltransferase